MTEYRNLNDGSSRSPRLRVGQTLWGLSNLPLNAEVEWTLEEKLSRVKNAGFEHLECWLDDSNEAAVGLALRRHGMGLILGHRPYNTEDVTSVLERATRQNAEFVFCQPASAFTPLHEVAEIVTFGSRMAAERGLPFFVETHRNNFTENIGQTLQLIEAVPNIRLTADLSHFVVVGEFYGWDGEGAIDRLDPILQHAAHFHGRVSNGEQVQVDVGDGSTPPARFFVKLWTRICQHWLRQAQPGDILPFSSELGPPRYAITLPDGREFSDRWEQGLVLKALAEEAWATASGA